MQILFPTQSFNEIPYDSSFRKISRNYLMGYFIWDILSCLPCILLRDIGWLLKFNPREVLLLGNSMFRLVYYAKLLRIC